MSFIVFFRNTLRYSFLGCKSKHALRVRKNKNTEFLILSKKLVPTLKTCHLSVLVAKKTTFPKQVVRLSLTCTIYWLLISTQGQPRLSRGCLYNYCYGAYFVLSQCSNLNHTARIRGVSLRFPCYNLTFHLLVATIRADCHHHLRVWSPPYTQMLANNSRKVFRIVWILPFIISLQSAFTFGEVAMLIVF